VNQPQPLAFLHRRAQRKASYYLSNPHSKIGCFSACDYR